MSAQVAIQALPAPQFLDILLAAIAAFGGRPCSRRCAETMQQTLNGETAYPCGVELLIPMPTRAFEESYVTEREGFGPRGDGGGICHCPR